MLAAMLHPSGPAAVAAGTPAPVAAPPAGAGEAPSLTATPSAPSATANPAATDPLMAEGMQAFGEGRYFDAAGAFYRVLQIDPGHADAKRMGYVACEFISLAEIRSALVQRTTTDAARASAKSDALAAVAQAGAGTLPVADARSKVVAALALSPDDAELQAAQKALEGKAASVARAVSAGKAAAQTKDLQAKLTSAQADLDAGKLTRAVKGFEAVMAADPTHSTPEFYQAQEGEQAAKDRMRTESKAAWADANAAIKVEDWLTARKRLAEVVSVDPYNDAAAAKLGEAKKHLKESASEVYKEARVLEEMGQTEKALALYHKVQLYVGDESDPLYGKAQTRMDTLLR
jgi:tetratricopeptide (TPR) repeat protein